MLMAPPSQLLCQTLVKTKIFPNLDVNGISVYCVSVLPHVTSDMINYYLSGNPRMMFLRSKTFLNYSHAKMSVAS